MISLNSTISLSLCLAGFYLQVTQHLCFRPHLNEIGALLNNEITSILLREGILCLGIYTTVQKSHQHHGWKANLRVNLFTGLFSSSDLSSGGQTEMVHTAGSMESETDSSAQ